MSRQDAPFSKKDLFEIGIRAGSFLYNLDLQTRPIGKRAPRSSYLEQPSYSQAEGRARLWGILGLLEQLDPGLEVFADQYSQDLNLRLQIDSRTDPIEVGEPHNISVLLHEFAGSLAIMAAGTDSFARGYFNDKEVWAAPGQLVSQIVRFHYEGPPMEISALWNDHLRAREASKQTV